MDLIISHYEKRTGFEINIGGGTFDKQTKKMKKFISSL